MSFARFSAMRSLRLPQQPLVMRRGLSNTAPRLNADVAANAKKAAEGASQQAKQAAEGASQQAKQAAQGASEQLAGAADKARQLGAEGAKRLQGATGINFGALSDTIYYNLRVAGSLFKQVYIAEGLAPPTNVNTLREAYSTLYKRAIDGSYWSKVANNGEWKKIAIYGVEALGIFTIGEMIGRRHIVGYKLNKSAPDHGHH